jgi:DNA helicase-2/ATP-dependent DNA helicase PcrA
VKQLEELNDSQRIAAEHLDGPLMVIAGAGSGKTRVLTYRIANLIANGVAPFSILALTFTNKAAKEMKLRIGNLVGEEHARNLWMGTFHSVFARILRVESQRINFPSNFTIYDTQDSRSVIKDVVKSLALDDKVYKPNTIHGRISMAKNNLIGPTAYAQNSEALAEDHQAGRPRTGDIYAAYQARLFRSGAMDFDDLLYKMNTLLRDFPDLLAKYQHKFRYLLVDEYQDTNFSQYLIIKQLAEGHHNVCVVGDDAQSIYSFRGADISNILNFKKDYPESVIYKLEQNYRSTKVIVAAANSVIGKNQDQIQKTVWTDNGEGEKVLVHRALTDKDEGYFVADSIFDVHHNKQAAYSDFAILYRTNSQSRAFEEQLRKRNLPFRIFGGLSFFQRKEVKDLLAYYRLTANSADDESLKRIVNYPARGIGKTTIDRVAAAAGTRDISLWDVLTDEEMRPDGIAKGAWGKLQDFVSMIRSFSASMAKQNAFDLGQHIAMHTGLLGTLHRDKTPEGVARYENVQELLAGIKSFASEPVEDDPEAVKTLVDYLIDVALLTDVEQEDDDPNKVGLMTVHSAKGLEFPYVFVVGMEEELFPSSMANGTREELEEERRLFYVALTRAKKKATLSYAVSRFRFGKFVQNDPSRFIEEIDEQYVDLPVATSGGGASGWGARRPAGGERWSGGGAKGYYKGGGKAGAVAGTGSRAGAGGAAAARKAAEKAIGGLGGATPKLKKVARPAVVTETATGEAGGIAPGVEVVHERFGKGKVLKIEGDAPHLKATVFFPTSGQKQLLLQYAKLKVLA